MMVPFTTRDDVRLHVYIVIIYPRSGLRSIVYGQSTTFKQTCSSLSNPFN